MTKVLLLEKKIARSGLLRISAQFSTHLSAVISGTKELAKEFLHYDID